MAIFGPNIKKLAASRDVEGLMRVLAGGGPSQQERAGNALAAIGQPAVEALIANAEAIGRPAQNALALIGEPAVRPVLHAIRAGETRLLGTLTLLALSQVPGALNGLQELAAGSLDEFVTAAAQGQFRVIGEMVRSLPMYPAPATPRGDDRIRAAERLASLQGRPVEGWATCPGCEAALGRRVDGAVQCERCARCFTDPGLRPVVSLDRIGWGRLDGAAPQGPGHEYDLQHMGESRAWTPMPPEFWFVMSDGVTWDRPTFDLSMELEE